MSPLFPKLSRRATGGRAPRIFFILGVAVSSGCYSYVPARMESIEPGQAVRVRLSPEEAERLVEVRRTDTRVMDGVVIRFSDDELLVDTPVGRLDPMAGSSPLNQRVNVPAGEIRDIELRELDRLKTGAALGGVGLVVGVGIAAAIKGGFGERSGEGDGPAENRRYPPLILRLPLPF